MKIDSLLTRVTRPSRYLGSEWNSSRKDWENAAIRVALAFPDMYEIGMSHQGLQILYNLINRRREFLAERVYAPAPDMEEQLRKYGEPLFSLESRHPLAEFDILGITLPYELCSSNILTILDLAGIPFFSSQRDRDMPLIIGGGPSSFNPEPVADFFDAILLGDGEEAILEIVQLVKEWKISGSPKDDLLVGLSEISGVYIPRFFQPHYDNNGKFSRIEALISGYDHVSKRVLAHLDPDLAPIPPIVPYAKTVHDRLGVEIARGCTRGCRFCQAGMIYRPVRERNPADVYGLACRGVQSGGFEELALLSLSTGDYSQLPEVLLPLMDHMSQRQVSVSMPSMRVGTLTKEIMEQIRRVRKTGFTLAPEAGTDRLRRVINKGITEADLLEASRAAFSLGWKLMKFYFMFGLPTETMDDMEGIAQLVGKAQQQASGGRGKINVSVATFVPKSHTPFQWEEQMRVDEAFQRIDFLKSRFKGRGATLKWNDPRMSFLEGVFSRGDRRLGKVIVEAWQRGARFDSWSDHFALDRWQQSAESCGINLDSFLDSRSENDPLPWEHLRIGLSDGFLAAERARSRTEEYTPDCRVHGCQKCGVCDFKVIMPEVYAPPWKGDPGKICRDETDTVDPDSQSLEKHTSYLYKMSYSRRNDARFLGHLEFLQVFFRACRRAAIPLAFSQGFHPTPQVSFSPALPLGTESEAEYVVAELTVRHDNPDSLRLLLNASLPGTIRIKKVEEYNAESNKTSVSGYHITMPDGFERGSIENFQQLTSFPVVLIRKGKKRHLDVLPFVKHISVVNENEIRLELISIPSKAGIKPLELVSAILEVDKESLHDARVLKEW